MAKSRYEYDVFISHAVEDKIPIANELWYRLKEEGLKAKELLGREFNVWYSGRELLAGHSLVESIHEGLQNSEYGVVILSPNFIASNWTLREFYTLLAHEENHQKKIIPIHFNITAEDLAHIDPTMVDRFAIDASKGMDHVVKKILERIGYDRRKEAEAKKKKQRRNTIAVMIAIAITTMFGYGGYHFYADQFPSSSDVERAINDRIEAIQEKVDQHQSQFESSGAMPCLLKDIDSLYTLYTNTQSYYRNAYELDNGYTTVRFKKNIEPVLNVELDSFTPYNRYTFTEPQIFKWGAATSGAASNVQYVLVNTRPVNFNMVDTKLYEDKYLVVVHYENNIRCVAIDLTFPATANDIKRHEMSIIGLFPQEQYVFEREGEEWKLITVELPEN